MKLPKMPSFRLEGRKALVTGGSRGIGLGGAVALGSAGASVTIAARSGVEVEAAASAMRADGMDAVGATLDVTNRQAVSSFIAEHGPFDILFNNAGTNRPGPYDAVSEEDFDLVQNLNIKSAFFVAQQVASSLKAAGKPGSIIHTSSQMGHVGGLDRSIYCTTKFAIEGLTKATAIELAPYGIRVNTLCPTFIRTPMTEGTLDDPDKKAWIESKIKLGRIGEIEDIMGAVLYLASDASSLVTGTSLIVDGGWTAG